MPKISVVIPLYNGKKFIVETIDSVLAQTRKDYEIIVVDDGSTDGAYEEIWKLYGEKIRLFRQENQGIAAARNKAILEARGEFIAFLDHDDIWLPTKLEKQMRMFEANPGVGLVYSNSVILDEGGIRNRTIFDIEPPKRGHAFYDLLKADFIPVMTAITRKDILLDAGLFDKKFIVAEDWDLFLKIARKHEIDYIDEVLVKYRVHAASHSRKRTLMLRELNAIMDSYLADVEIKKDKSALSKIAHMSASYKCTMVLAYLNEGDKRSAFDALKECAALRKNIFRLCLVSFIAILPLRASRWIIGKHTSVAGMHLEDGQCVSSAKRLKILYVIDSSEIGGSETELARLMKYIDPDKYEPYLVCPAGGKMVGIYRRYAKQVYELRVKTFFSISAIRAVASIIEKEDIDIVHSKLFTSDFCAAIAAIIKNRIYIATVVGYNFFNDGKNIIKRVRKSILSLIYRAVYISARHVIAVSSAVKNDLHERPGINVNPKKIKVIYCGLPEIEVSGTEDARRRYLINPEERLVSCIANLYSIKGLIYLIRSIPFVLEQFPRTRFFFIGDGPERKSLESEVNRLGVDKNTLFTGHLGEEEKNALLYLSDMTVLPSLSEGLGQVIIEAMILKKPVIATNVGGIPELITDKENGLLVEPRDPRAMADAIIVLLKDALFAKRLGENGRLVYEKKFFVKQMVDAASSIYESAVKKPRVFN
ncbi:MAG: glycosyltransferase [Candidatus Omnitrophota bacterium]|jgi:glycosyltransferase involved in cell wall biosynthesis